MGMEIPCPFAYTPSSAADPLEGADPHHPGGGIQQRAAAVPRDELDVGNDLVVCNPQDEPRGQAGSDVVGVADGKD